MNADSRPLAVLADLSREFGGPDHVVGGGGNCSVKDRRTLWIKPSGMALSGMTPDSFVALDRDRLRPLYGCESEAEPAGRESRVKGILESAVLPGSIGRPSVEAPLHDLFSAAYVMHTHPAAVNAMTCGLDGAGACGRLFPNALWIPYADPGYALSVRARAAFERWRRARGGDPETVFLQNHGVFFGADTPGRIRLLVNGALRLLRHRIRDAAISPGPEAGPAPGSGRAETARTALREAFGADAAHVAVSGRFPLAPGALTPDHVVYGGSEAFEGPAEAGALKTWAAKRGRAPRVAAFEDSICGLGRTARAADIALASARDGARVARYAEAFGGARYLAERDVAFIENWEAEQYRQRLAESEEPAPAS